MRFSALKSVKADDEAQISRKITKRSYTPNVELVINTEFITPPERFILENALVSYSVSSDWTINNGLSGV